MSKSLMVINLETDSSCSKEEFAAMLRRIAALHEEGSTEGKDIFGDGIFQFTSYKG